MSILSCLLLVSFLIPQPFGISPSFQPVIEVFFKLVSKNFVHVIRRNGWDTKCLKLRRIRMHRSIWPRGPLIQAELALELVALEALVELARIRHSLKSVELFIFVFSNRCMRRAFSVLLILVEGVYVSTFFLAKMTELSISHSTILILVQVFKYSRCICRCQLNFQTLQPVHEIILRKFARLF